MIYATFCGCSYRRRDPGASLRRVPWRQIHADRVVSFSDRSKLPSLDELSAFIRVGQKYQMTELYEQALAHIKLSHTSNLDSWRKQKYWVPKGCNEIHAIGIINLARLTGELSILPTAFLACEALTGEIVRGFARADGTQENLTLEDLAICFNARTRIREVSIQALLRIFSLPVTPNCKTKNLCRKALRGAMQGLKGHVTTMMHCDPFTDYIDYVKGGKLGMCSKCLKIIDRRQDKEHRAIWNKLPELLGIAVPGWGEPDLAEAVAV